MKTSDDPIKKEIRIDCNSHELWNALTDPFLMRQWFFSQIADFKALKGFETKFVVENEGRRFTHFWKVTETVPLEYIEWDWIYEEYKGVGRVAFKINNDRPTTLYFEMNVLQDFNSEIPEFTRESCQGGWDYFLDQQLKQFLES